MQTQFAQIYIQSQRGPSALRPGSSDCCRRVHLRVQGTMGVVTGRGESLQAAAAVSLYLHTLQLYFFRYFCQQLPKWGHTFLSIVLLGGGLNARGGRQGRGSQLRTGFRRYPLPFWQSHRRGGSGHSSTLISPHSEGSERLSAGKLAENDRMAECVAGFSARVRKCTSRPAAERSTMSRRGGEPYESR